MVKTPHNKIQPHAAQMLIHALDPMNCEYVRHFNTHSRKQISRMKTMTQADSERSVQ